VNIVVNPSRVIVSNGPAKNITWLLAGTPGAVFAPVDPISFYPQPPWTFGLEPGLGENGKSFTIDYDNNVSDFTLYGYNIAISYLGTIYNVDPEVGNDPPGHEEHGDHDHGKPPKKPGRQPER
jgi:hypothetical protein